MDLSIFKVEVLGNRLTHYLTAAVVFLILLLLLRILQRKVFTRFKSWAEKNPDPRQTFVLSLIQQSLIPLLYAGAFYFGLQQLVLSEQISRFVNLAAVCVMTFQLTQLVLAVTVYLLEKTWFNPGQAGVTSVHKSILTLIKFAGWSIAFIFVLDNLGFNVSAVVAGLGIGGIAVALAAQTILGDLFNYFVIFFDRPFEEGDSIVFEEYQGVIENIGIKSTRIRALGGEQIVISNSNLTGAKIRNYKRMAQRRVLFSLGVIYETPKEKLEKIPGLIRSMIEAAPNTRFDRAHFKEFGEFSLNFEVVYFAVGADYNAYMDTRQKINFAILDVFAREKIEFAYPTSVQYHK